MIVIQDSKEKYPWDFTFHGFEQRVHGLKTGDYTLEGYESQLCIERKRNTGEISINLGSKRKQFYAELERMSTFKYRYLVLEFSFLDVQRFPENSGIPKHKLPFLRMNRGFLISSLNSIPEQFGVNVIYANDTMQAELAVAQIFNEVANGIDPQVTNPL